MRGIIFRTAVFLSALSIGIGFSHVRNVFDFFSVAPVLPAGVDIIVFDRDVPDTVSVPAEKSIVGSWKLMGMSKKPFEIERITESEVMQGRLTFKTDKTFDGEIIYPKSPDKNLQISGTYNVENDVLTVVNQTNASTTESTVKFEKDFLIGTPLNPDGFIMYLKRIN